MEDQHGGSSRIPFILQLFFKNSLEVMIRQAILKDKHGVLHMFCFEEFKHSSSCIPKCNSLYLIFRDGAISFLTIPLHGSWFTSCPEWHILKPSISIRSRDLFNPLISLLELSWYRFHLKPSRRNVANCGVYQWSKFSPILSAREVFISSLISSNHLFPLVAEFHLIILRCVP